MMTPKKEMISLTDEQITCHDSQEHCRICKEEFCDDMNCENYMNKRKVRDHCHYTGEYRGAAHSICNLRYSDQRVIPVIAHNASNYHNHFIIKELAKRFKGKIDCIGENMEKYISFSVFVKIENDEEKPVTYKLKFIDNKRFMNTFLSKLVDNMSEINKYESDAKEFREKIELLKKFTDNYSRIKTKIYTKNLRSMIDKLKTLNDSYPDDNEFTNDMRSKINELSDLNDKCSSNLESNFVKNMKSNIARLTQSYNRYIEISKKLLLLDLKEKFSNTYRLANDDLNKFLLLLRKGVYPYSSVK